MSEEIRTLSHVEGLTGMNLKDAKPLHRAQIALYLAGIMKPTPEAIYATIRDLSERFLPKAEAVE